MYGKHDQFSMAFSTARLAALRAADPSVPAMFAPAQGFWPLTARTRDVSGQKRRSGHESEKPVTGSGAAVSPDAAARPRSPGAPPPLSPPGGQRDDRQASASVANNCAPARTSSASRT